VSLTRERVKTATGVIAHSRYESHHFSVLSLSTYTKQLLQAVSLVSALLLIIVYCTSNKPYRNRSDLIEQSLLSISHSTQDVHFRKISYLLNLYPYSILIILQRKGRRQSSIFAEIMYLIGLVYNSVCALRQYFTRIINFSPS
jgi:hypothetical protein